MWGNISIETKKGTLFSVVELGYRMPTEFGYPRRLSRNETLQWRPIGGKRLLQFSFLFHLLFFCPAVEARTGSAIFFHRSSSQTITFCWQRPIMSETKANRSYRSPYWVLDWGGRRPTRRCESFFIVSQWLKKKENSDVYRVSTEFGAWWLGERAA